METQTKEILIEKFNSFQSQVQALRQKPAGLEQELSVKRLKLERLRTARFSQLALEEVEKAKILAKEIDKLEPEIEILEAKISAFGPGGKESVQALVAAAPGSELFIMAESIVEAAAAVAPDLEKELQYFISWKSEELKQEYLSKIGDFSEQHAELWELSYSGITAGKYLPPERRKCKKPRLVPPLQSLFEIGINDVGQVYRPLSRTSLPD
jgi:hypothetical protein